MTRLLEAAQELELNAECSHSGRWIRFQGEQATVTVVEAAWDAGYFMWCDAPRQRPVEPYLDAYAAIRAGLQRAALPSERQAVHPVVARRGSAVLSQAAG